MGRQASIFFACVFALWGLASTASAVPVAAGDTPAALATLAAPASRTGNLTTRPAGFPRSPDPARNMVSAVVTQDLSGGRVTGTVTLGAAPTPATDSYLGITFGHAENGGCTADFAPGSYLTPPMTGGFTVSGATVTFDLPSEAAATGQWNCASALLYQPGAIDASTAFDGLSGTLEGPNGTPQLRFSGVAVDGKPVRKKLKLVPRAKTTIDVSLENPGDGDAGQVVLSGQGKGIKVKKATYPAVDAGAEATASLRVKLAPGVKKSKLKLTAEAAGATAKLKIPVKAAKR